MIEKVKANCVDEAASQGDVHGAHWENWPGVWQAEDSWGEPPETIEFGDFDEMTEERSDYWRAVAKQRKKDRRKARWRGAVSATRLLAATMRRKARWAKVLLKRRLRRFARQGRRRHAA
ncbi:MAG: hypothetical protein M3O74_10520 [Pseudomonadota bacterium]|uniref:Uncharacterized protein n=1 Tax=Caballeronia udeis TaxID=1232866 RepID=A0A158EVD1_9BURK|nr:hypothetical protein [Pseudomonadota bacterium]SAL11483.1 hypothetical protein AWB69_00311 [Caballeronia udeis]